MRVLNEEISGKKSVIFHKNDQKILSLLCYNVRLPVSKIAKLLNLSRQSVEYRIKVMEKNHIIAGSRSVININKLGYQSFHYFLTIQSSGSEKIFLERAKKDPRVNALISYSGKWNYELSIMEKNADEAQKVFLELTEKVSVIDYHPCIILNTIKASVLPLYVSQEAPMIKNLKNDPSFSKQFSGSKKDYVADEKDKKILYELSQDAQLSMYEIGDKVGLSNDAVSYRIKKMISGSYIHHFRPVIDFSSLGLSIQAVLIKNSINKSKDDLLQNYLKGSDNILWATKIFGSWDYLVYVINKDSNEIHSFIDGLKENFGDYIKSYEVLFAYNEYKYSFMTLPMVK